MLIHTRGEVIECQPKRGAKSSPSVLWLKLSIPMDGLGDAEIAKLSRFKHGPTIGLALDLGPFVSAGTGKSGNGRQATIDDAASAPRRRPERVTPLPEERCQGCGSRIGADPERRMYAPISGPPQPMHGACADEADRLRDQAVSDVADAFLPPEPRPEDAAPVELLAPSPVPVPTELPVAAIGAEGEAIGADWPSTTDPRPGRVADPEAAAALGEVAPHIERVAAEVDESFEQLVGPSAATRKRRARATV